MKDVLVIVYHAVTRRRPVPISVGARELERHLMLLIRRGYSGATFSEAVLGQRPGKVFAVTFDDAYSSVCELGFPILDRLGLTGTVFACTGVVGSATANPLGFAGLDREQESELTCMSWDQLRWLADQGWEIGSHTVTHAPLTRLDEGALARELEESKQQLESELGRSCRSMAYPGGDTDTRVRAAAARAGYRAAGALHPGLFTAPPPLQWPRLGADQATIASFALRTSRAFRRVRSSRVWDLQLRARGIPVPVRPGES